MKAHIDSLNPRLSRKQTSFLNLAMRVSASSDCVQKHGAVIVRGGSVLAVGHNKWRNILSNVVTNAYNNQRNGDVAVHAEIDALSRVSNPNGATIYIARISPKGKPLLSKPCPACAKALDDAGISKIVYTV